jgi:protein ImuB
VFACLVEAGRIERGAPEAGKARAAALMAVAQAFSPRVEPVSAQAVVCDLSGLERLFGTARAIAEEMRREAADRGLAVRVAVAATRTAARLLAYGRPGLTVVEAGAEADAVRSLPLTVLHQVVAADVPPLSSGPRLPARFYRTSPMEALARQMTAELPRSRTAELKFGPTGVSAVPTELKFGPTGVSAVPTELKFGPTGVSAVPIELKSGAPGVSAVRSAELQFGRFEDILATLSRWGLKTLGDLVSLSTADLSERLGQEGVALQRIARGEDAGPLVPVVPEERFESHLDLEWPIEGLEPLSFVLGRLLEPVCAHLERRGRAAAVITVELRLVSRDTHVRRLQLPAPVRDARVLRTLVLLDLESHPPGAGIDAVDVRIEPTPGRVLQYSLLERAQPAPEQMSTLLARLSALMGQERCGSPRLPDTHRPGAFTMAPFAADQSSRSRQVQRDPVTGPPPLALRRYREPVPIRVALEQNRPARVVADRVGVAAGRVDVCAGPWRTSGEWWADGWRRDEWDVALDDGTVCRIFQDRGTQGWFIDAVID